MSEAGISLDRARWKRELDEFERRTGLDRAWVLRNSFRMLVNDLVRFTYPKNLKQGKNRVSKDLRKIFVPITDQMKLLEGEVIGDQAVAFKTKTGAVYGVDRDLFRPGASTEMMRPHHQRYRRKDGRVTSARGGSEQGRNTLNIGRWKFVDKMHVPERTFRKYEREVWGHIGRLKAGWLAAVVKFGGKAGEFVRRHSLREGSATDALDQRGNGYLEAVNRVPYARDKISGVLRFAEQRARRNLQYRLEKTLERAEKEYNRKKAA